MSSEPKEHTKDVLFHVLHFIRAEAEEKKRARFNSNISAGNSSEFYDAPRGSNSGASNMTSLVTLFFDKPIVRYFTVTGALVLLTVVALIVYAAMARSQKRRAARQDKRSYHNHHEPGTQRRRSKAWTDTTAGLGGGGGGGASKTYSLMPFALRGGTKK